MALENATDLRQLVQNGLQALTAAADKGKESASKIMDAATDPDGGGVVFVSAAADRYNVRNYVGYASLARDSAISFPIPLLPPVTTASLSAHLFLVAYRSPLKLCL